MGLDMYLSFHHPTDGEIEVGYWRKANAIHGWFVEHNQGGEDDSTKDYLIDLETLFLLKEDVNIVLDAFKRKHPDVNLSEIPDTLILDEEFLEVAEAHLPPTRGFFFGSDTIDDWYIQHLVRTLKIIDKAEELSASCGKDEFVYMAWW